MAKRNKKKKEKMSFEIPKEILREAQKPRYNSHQGGYGVHKSPKDYSRKTKHKKNYANEY